MTYGNVRSQNQRPMFDTIHYAAAAAMPPQLSFFSAGRTQGINGPHVTNIKRSGVLNNGEKFTCYGLSFVVINPLPADLNAIYLQYVARLVVNSVTKLEGGVEAFPALGGLSGAVATTVAAATVQQWTNGVPANNSIHEIGAQYPIVIDGGEPFSVDMLGLNGIAAVTGAVDIRCYLLGVWEENIGV